MVGGVSSTIWQEGLYWEAGTATGRGSSSKYGVENGEPRLLGGREVPVYCTTAAALPRAWVLHPVQQLGEGDKPDVLLLGGILHECNCRRSVVLWWVGDKEPVVGSALRSSRQVPNQTTLVQQR